MNDSTLHWTNAAKKQLVGRKIVQVRYMTSSEAKDMDWSSRPVVLMLDDGNQLFPSSDDEGNNAGALFTSDKENDVLPVLSVEE